MTTATSPAPAAPLYTVWVRARFVGSTEVWVGEDFTKALQVALDQVGSAAASPIDHTNVVALRSVGRPVSAWGTVDADGEARTVFITV